AGAMTTHHKHRSSASLSFGANYQMCFLCQTHGRKTRNTSIASYVFSSIRRTRSSQGFQMASTVQKTQRFATYSNLTVKRVNLKLASIPHFSSQGTGKWLAPAEISF